MRVRTLQSLTTPRGEIPAGKIITIPDHLMERLRGKVEPIAETAPFRGAVEIITNQGKVVWIVTDDEAVKVVPPGCIYFTGAEVFHLKKTGKEAVRVALIAKEVFSNDAVIVGNDVPTHNTS